MSQRAHAWLSQGAETLALLQQQANDEVDCDVLIVGSGYGGAVAAARLAGSRREGRPARVWLLERGAEFQPGRFPSRFAELPGQVRFSIAGGPPRGRDEGLFDFRIGPDVSLLLANGLGGGSLINAGVMLEPEPDIWQRDWPAGIDAASMAPHYAAAREVLQQQPHPDPGSLDKYAAFAEAADRAGATVTAAPVTLFHAAGTSAAGVPMSSCSACGDCATGCNQGAKGSLDTSYLALAAAGGVSLFCGGSVEHLAPQADGSWRVHWRYTDSQLHRRLQRPRPLHARNVVLAAGSLGSTEILMRSRQALGLADAPLGQRFSINGDAIGFGVGPRRRVGAVADAETDPADDQARRVGATITGVVRLRDGQGKPFAVQEFGIPAALRQLVGEVAASVRAMPALMGVSDTWRDGAAALGADPAAVTEDLIQRSSVYGLMGDDGAAGQLVARADEEGAVFGLHVHWPGVHQLPHFGAMHQWLGRALHPGAAVTTSSLLLGQAPAFAVHPLGGCGMADNCQHGVVNANGEVFDRRTDTSVWPGLAVLDGAIVPRALGINPALTITALAERALPELMVHWGLQRGGERRPLPPRPRGRRHELPAPEATWMLRERMQGRCVLGGRPLQAQLDTEFEPLPGMVRALALGRRWLAVRRSVLTLFEVDDQAAPSLERPRAVAQAQLSGGIEIFAPMPDAEDRRVQLVYRLSLQSVSDPGGLGLAVGMPLTGVKTWGVPPDTSEERWRSPLVDLTELQVRIGPAGPFTWSLDLDDLADRGEALLSAQSLSSLPDALADLLGMGGYVLRRSLQQLLVQHLSQAENLPPIELAAQRYPGRWTGGPEPEFVPDPKTDPKADRAGWRLTRYRHDKPTQAPVLLIHGLGTAGASFTHAAIGRPLAQHLHDSGREVWVLDLRSSIGNEHARRLPAAAQWTVDEVAADIRPALERVCTLSGQRQVDVVAHCMGAVMFILRALSDDQVGTRVRSAVLSQVGPLARLSPLNRARGTIGAYLRTFFDVDEFDPTPEFKSRIDDKGVVHWTLAEPFADGVSPGDLLAAAFPYDDDDRRTEDRIDPEGRKPFRLVRRRADAIFGQLFELQNLSAQTLDHLPALFGWVKVGMLAQAIQFLRLDMLANASGRNEDMRRETFERGFAFPLLLLHGRRNRVFQWQGSLRSLKLLRRLRGQSDDPPRRDDDHRCWHYGAGSGTQLALFDDYGHLDCLLGEQAHRDIFPVVSNFLDRPGALPAPPQPKPGDEWQREIEAPRIGPLLGWLHSSGTPRHPVQLRVLLHAAPERSRSHGVAAVPMRAAGGRLLPLGEQARWLSWGDPRSQQAQLDLLLDPADPALASGVFALLTLHKDSLPDDSGAAIADDRGKVPAGDDDHWLARSRLLFAPVMAKVAAWIEQHRDDGLFETSLVRLSQAVFAARDLGKAADKPQPLVLALSSCQYPPGLFDAAPADATWRRLLADLGGADPPQLLLLAGDQVYVDETGGMLEAHTALQREVELDQTYERSWTMPAFRRVAARLPIYPMLDDHEVHDNWQGLRDPARDVVAALAAYQRFQGSLAPCDAGTRIGAQGSRSYAVHPGGVPLLVMDTRSGRHLRQPSTLKKASIFDEDTWRDLEQRLAAAPDDAVKLLLLPVPLLPPERLCARPLAERIGSDTWSGFPASACRLLRFIGNRDKPIRRVLLLSGDSHLSSVSSLRLDGSGVQLVSVVSSGSYAPWPFANQRPDELLLDARQCFHDGAGPDVTGRFSVHAMSARSGYARLCIGPGKEPGDAPKLLVSLRSGDGGTVDVAPIVLN